MNPLEKAAKLLGPGYFSNPDPIYTAAGPCVFGTHGPLSDGALFYLLMVKLAKGGDDVIVAYRNDMGTTRWHVDLEDGLLSGPCPTPIAAMLALVEKLP